MNYYGIPNRSEYLSHAGKKGMKWGYTDGVRNGKRTAELYDVAEDGSPIYKDEKGDLFYQNKDGTRSYLPGRNANDGKSKQINDTIDYYKKNGIKKEDVSDIAGQAKHFVKSVTRDKINEISDRTKNAGKEIFKKFMSRSKKKTNIRSRG